MAEFGWSREERDALVRPYHASAMAMKAASLDLPVAEGAAKLRLAKAIGDLREGLVELSRLYLARLPDATLGRCPFTDVPTILGFDPYGLDGLFWERENPTRPPQEDEAGPHFIGLSGAVRFSNSIEPTSFLVVPGPGVPMLVRHVIEQPGVRAVLSARPIGTHLGYAVAYYAAEPKRTPRRPHLWGTKVTSLAPDHDPASDEPERERHFDYGLAPWIERGRLAWIDPDDADFTLRTGLEGCPFLDLTGEREIQYMHQGEVWT